MSNVFRSGYDIIVLSTEKYFRQSQHKTLKWISGNQPSHISKRGIHETDG
jgi:hypothetical protein